MRTSPATPAPVSLRTGRSRGRARDWDTPRPGFPKSRRRDRPPPRPVTRARRGGRAGTRDAIGALSGATTGVVYCFQTGGAVAADVRLAPGNSRVGLRRAGRVIGITLMIAGGWPGCSEQRRRFQRARRAGPHWATLQPIPCGGGLGFCSKWKPGSAAERACSHRRSVGRPPGGRSSFDDLGACADPAGETSICNSCGRLPRVTWATCRLRDRARAGDPCPTLPRQA
jgi:hypothetical protein